MAFVCSLSIFRVMPRLMCSVDERIVAKGRLLLFVFPLYWICGSSSIKANSCECEYFVRRKKKT